MSRPYSPCRRFLILSNNDLVVDSYPCVFVDGLADEVLRRGLDYVKEGLFTFYSHPFAGDVRLLRNPYRTVVLEEANGESTCDIIFFLDRLKSVVFDESPMASEDYKIIDYDLFISLNLRKGDLVPCRNSQCSEAETGDERSVRR